jgi:hypothetical protein
MKLIAIDNIKSTNLTFVNLQGESLIEIIKDKVYENIEHNFHGKVMHHEEYLIVNEFEFSKWYKTDKFRTISEDREHKLKQIGI